MRCTNCKRELEPDFKFCPYCKKPVKSTQTIQTKASRNLVMFSDINLELAVMDTLKKANGHLTVQDIVKLIKLEVRQTLYLRKNHNLIRNLTGLESATDLQALDLQYNQIRDIGPLASLAKLTKLNLYDNQIRDLSPIQSLTNLTGTLYLGKNQISDLSPLRSLVKLTGLNVRSNKIRDLSPLKSLINLKHIYLLDNHIVSDLSALKALPKLTRINLEQNPLGPETIEVEIPELLSKGIFVDW